MAVTVSYSPAQKLYPAGQYLIYTLDEASTPDRYIVEVYRSTSTTTIGTLLSKVYLTPNNSGKVHYDLSAIAEGVMRPPLSSGGESIHSHQTASKIFQADELTVAMFTLRFGQYNGTTETLNEVEKKVYIGNGVEQITSGLLPSFVEYYPTSNNRIGWLTDRKRSDPEDDTSEIQVSMAEEDQAVGLIYITDNLGTATSVTRCRVRQYNTSGTFVAYIDIAIPSISATIARQSLLAVPIGPAHWSHLGLNAACHTAKFRLETSSGGDKCVELAVTKDHPRPCNHDATQVAWLNTRGGWDYLRFDSRSPLNVNVTGKTFRKQVGTYGSSTFSLSTQMNQYETYAKTGKEAYTLSENFFSAEERDLLQYLMRSKVVQMRRGTGTWEPVVVRSNSLTIEPAGSRFYNVSLDVELGRDVRC